MSHNPGSTLMPSVEITSAPDGMASAPCTPTAVIRSPSIRITLLRTGRPPKPSMSVPPTSAFTRVWAGGSCLAGTALPSNSSMTALAAPKSSLVMTRSLQVNLDPRTELPGKGLPARRRSTFVELHAVTPSLLGAVQRRVRGVQDQLGSGVSLRSLCDADADADVDPRDARRCHLSRPQRLAGRPIGTAQNKTGVGYGTAERLHERLRLLC